LGRLQRECHLVTYQPVLSPFEWNATLLLLYCC
jgi:hypothetical protein